MNGIDVSHYQGSIDWYHANTDFIYIKVTQAAHWVDPLATENWNGATALDIPTGGYHFLDPAYDVKVQAGLFAARLTGLIDHGATRDTVLVPAVDLEATSGNPQKDSWLRIPASERMAVIMDFCTTLEKLLNVQPILYVRTNWLTAIPDTRPLRKYNLWLAHYHSGLFDPEWIPKGWRQDQVKIWQYGQITSSGIQVPVDGDKFMGNDIKEITWR